LVSEHDSGFYSEGEVEEEEEGLFASTIGLDNCEEEEEEGSFGSDLGGIFTHHTSSMFNV
jgi:hypothetical protein